jgi:uncharacterized protein YbjT (DUF2867 family)
MSEHKTIAVVGATGATAGGLARAILSDPDAGFTCRAITRTPDSAAARALADLGATVVPADLDEPDSLVDAFDGAYGAFCMTTFWDHFSPERETSQAGNQARAAAAAGVQHAIWSTMEDTRRWYPLQDDRMPTVMGGYKVPPFDAKADGNQAFEAAGVPTTYLLPPTHWDAFVSGRGAPQPGPDGALSLAIPLGDAALPGIAAEDIGRCAYGIFQQPEQYRGTTVGLAAECTTGQRLADGLSTVFGQQVRYQPMPLEAFRSLPFPGIDIAANMFQFMAEVPDHAALRDPAVARSLNPSLSGFDAWVQRTRSTLAATVHAP